MVTTRSRKQVGDKPGQGVAAQSAAVPTLKRKSTASSSAESSTTPTKIPRTSLDSDLLAEAKLPQAPASTPAILNDISNAKERQPEPPFSNSSVNSTGHINNGNRDQNNIIVSQPEMPLTATPSAPPLASTAPLAGGSDKSGLEAIKEPAPESTSMMPEVTTVLTAPVTDQLIESLVASSSSAPLAVPPPPPAPTAPEVSSVSAVAPLETKNLEDLLSTHTVAGATTAPVLPPIPTGPVFSPLVPATASVTTNATSLPNFNGNNYAEQPPANGRLSSTLVGIDAATANAAHAQAQAQAQAQPHVQNQAAQVGNGGVGTNKLEEQNKPGQVLAGKTDQGPDGATTTISTLL